MLIIDGVAHQCLVQRLLSFIVIFYLALNDFVLLDTLGLLLSDPLHDLLLALPLRLLLLLLQLVKIFQLLLRPLHPPLSFAIFLLLEPLSLLLGLELVLKAKKLAPHLVFFKAGDCFNHVNTLRSLHPVALCLGRRLCIIHEY